jgi:hypothetical protein
VAHTTATRLGTKAERKAFVSDLEKALDTIAAPVALTFTPRPDLDSVEIEGPGLSVLFSMAHMARSDADRVPMLSWHSAVAPLASTAGWQSINPHHGCKASGFPKSLEELVSMILAGLEAAHDGSAFRGDLP